MKVPSCIWAHGILLVQSKCLFGTRLYKLLQKTPPVPFVPFVPCVPCVPCTTVSSCLLYTTSAPFPHETSLSVSRQATTSQSWTTPPTTGWAPSPGRPCRPTVTPSCSSPSSALAPPNSWRRTSVQFSGLPRVSSVFCRCGAEPPVSASLQTT